MTNNGAVMYHPLGNTHNDVPVYVDLVHSPAGKQIALQPRLVGLAREAVGQLSVRGQELHIDHDMGRPIGYSFIVKTDEKDSILYAQFLHDEFFTRFVKNGSPHSTRYLSVRLRRDEDGQYELRDTWIGRTHPPQPGSAHETAKSKVYWADHAYIFGTDDRPLRLSTLTKVCPYTE
jgi:hypothetical protein